MNATTDLRLAPARRGDLPRIAALARTAIEAGLGHAWTETRLGRSLRHPETMVLVAHARAPVPPAELGTAFAFAGFGIMFYGDSRAHLNLLGVEPRFRRLGIGRRILRWLERSALEAGTFEVGLELRAANGAAQAFYRALGYEPAGRVPGYYEGVEDALRMRRDLRATPAGRP
ncbi:MAG: GNAT family N-acetyltransferase [Steroidobacteraceae bacterium]|jgi:ribosomal-protein-alanine N-acetyltransferase|nr:GNAT family N-acetyltransferase [Steroidobacteraceae bacterium]